MRSRLDVSEELKRAGVGSRASADIFTCDRWCWAAGECAHADLRRRILPLFPHFLILLRVLGSARWRAGFHAGEQHVEGAACLGIVRRKREGQKRNDGAVVPPLLPRQSRRGGSVPATIPGPLPSSVPSIQVLEFTGEKFCAVSRSRSLCANFSLYSRSRIVTRRPDLLATTC